jgi:hypothetical protein
MFHSLVTSISLGLRSLPRQRHAAPADTGSPTLTRADRVDCTYVPGSYVLHDPYFIRPDLLSRFYSGDNRFVEGGRRARARWLPDKYEQNYHTTATVPDPRIEIYYSLLKLAKI